LFEIVLVLAQLRNVLAAEDSAVVAEKDDHCGAAGPEAIQTHRVPIQIGQCDAGQSARVGFRHGDILREGSGRVKEGSIYCGSGEPACPGTASQWRPTTQEHSVNTVGKADTRPVLDLACVCRRVGLQEL
jgi:hypothetical protein